MPWKIKYVQIVKTSSQHCPYGENDKCHWPNIGKCDEAKCPIKQWVGNEVDKTE